MGLSLGWEEGRQREPGLDSLGRGRRERKNSGVKTWCLGGGGGGVLEGTPLLRCRGDSKAGPSLSCEEGEWAGRHAGSPPAGCRLEFQPRSAVRGWPVRHRPEPLGLGETDPTPASFLSLGKRHTFLEGCDSVPGDCTFISDSRLFETDGLLGA